jgi:benzodiazapine receptor
MNNLIILRIVNLLYYINDSAGMNSRLFQTLNVIAVISTILLNALANILPFNGVLTATVSDSYPNLFTPPGYVFAIWGVIYVLIFTFMVFQVRKSQVGESYLQQIGALYLVGAIFNIGWLVMFHYSYGNPTLFVFTTIPILAFLVTLLLMYSRLEIGLKEVPLGQKLAVHLPVSVYLGWISLASIANIASAINVLVPGIALETQALWTAVMIVVALVLTTLMLFMRRDFAYGLVVIWASVGIATKQVAYPVIYFTAVGTALLIAALIVLVPFVKGTKRNPLHFYLRRQE